MIWTVFKIGLPFSQLRATIMGLQLIDMTLNPEELSEVLTNIPFYCDEQ